MKKGMTRLKLLNYLFIFISLVGIAIIFYPSISNMFYKITANKVIENYSKDINAISKKEKEKLINDARAYNDNSLVYRIEDAFDIDAKNKDDIYQSLLNYNEDGIMGYIEIPKISIRLPIYHGTTDEVLNKGVGHVYGTSLPVGGKSSHAILAAHRGLPSAKLFTDLNQLEKKDKFYIIISDEIFVYEVDNIEIIEPQDIDKLQIEKDKDYVTLFTCTPYAINTHRLLVRGKRIENTKDNIADVNKNNVNYTPLIMVIISMMITGGLMVYINHKYDTK